MSRAFTIPKSRWELIGRVAKLRMELRGIRPHTLRWANAMTSLHRKTSKQLKAEYEKLLDEKKREL